MFGFSIDCSRSALIRAGFFVAFSISAVLSAQPCFDWSTSWNFRPVEFNCKCGAPADCEMKESFMRKLDIARNRAGVRFVISSGFRTPEHNLHVGGTAKSSHITGHAADIYCVDDRTRWIIIEALIYAGFNRIGIYETHIHVDDLPGARGRVIWFK